MAAAYGHVAHAGIPVAEVGVDERAEFIRKTYFHLGFAILAFVGLSAILVNSGIAIPYINWLSQGRWNWLIVLGGFMVVGWLADYWARSATSVAMQYAGLSIYVVAEAFLFLPLLYIAARFTNPTVLPTAAILTLTVFGGMTAIAVTTKKDFSFLRQGLAIAGFLAMGLIVCSIAFDFNLGVIFSGVMVLLSAGYVLYYTSNILHHYPVGSHVAAALALFAAIALMFWYVLRLVMAVAGRD